MFCFLNYLVPVLVVVLPKAALSTIDASLWNNGSLPFVSAFQYKRQNGSSTTEKYKQACYHKQSRVANEFQNIKGGGYFKVTFRHLENAKLSVEDNYSSKKHSIPVLLQTKWLVVNNTYYNDLVRAFNEFTVLNVSFHTSITPNALSSCKGSKEVVVDVKWCKWAQVFTHHKIDGLPKYDDEGRCVVNRSDEAKHYLNMWHTGDNDEFKTKCTEGNKNCVNNVGNTVKTILNKKGASNCLDQVNFANGRGYIKNMEMGKTNEMDGKITHVDVNMTIDFDYWTSDFPEMFTNSHKNCLYYGNTSQLSIHFYLKEPVERKVPPQFFAFVLIACVLGLVMAIALTLVACTCSRQSFRMELWEYWVKRNAYRKYAKEHASEIAEQVADKRMEKQEAMMTTMLAEVGGE